MICDFMIHGDGDGGGCCLVFVVYLLVEPLALRLL